MLPTARLWIAVRVFFGPLLTIAFIAFKIVFKLAKSSEGLKGLRVTI
jgi:hypothetical protein